MAFILPDNILETLRCSFCHKYLSVQPVKVYPNRLMQCGRCNDNREQADHRLEAVESQYGKIAENVLFKCVNRFDGCRKLLTYSQVQGHEQVCLSKIHKCPICYEEMPSFLVLRHFRSNHKDATLDCPAFIFNLNDHLDAPSAYIFQEGDNLFSLYVSHRMSENTIKLDLVYMGNFESAKNIYHQFTLSGENKKCDIVLPTKSCNNDFFVVDISKMSSFVQIKFKLIDSNLKVLTSTEISNTVRKPVLKNARHRYQIGKDLSEFSLKCIKCQAYCIFPLSTCPIRYYYVDKQNNYICYYCYQWFKYSNEISGQRKEISFKRKHTREIIIDIMKFFKWNCGNCCSCIGFLDMQSHDINCKQGTQFSCPIKNCSEKGTAIQIIEHLKVHKCWAFSFHFKITSDIVRCFVFVEEYIVFLHLPRVQSTFIVSCNIKADLVTKTYDEKGTTLKPYVMFFDTNNQLLNRCRMDISTDDVYVKVIVE
ncbi:uncharacterized protein LOC114330887 [Diabrotica virgifera virgifera]|uniref:Uncharacterized protein LOC114330887 n=1 Tax=Diabrotica virgifera virgifera TaxID=50390 RepID=A0A6P7FJH4_DIAVI|nr:uncharacterized protein LOC114330887 [Diabrotica virgifera virgifera]